MHNNKFRVRSLLRARLKPKEKKEIAMMFRRGAGKSEHELGQVSKNNYSIDWTSSPDSSRRPSQAIEVALENGAAS